MPQTDDVRTPGYLLELQEQLARGEIPGAEDDSKDRERKRRQRDRERATRALRSEIHAKIVAFAKALDWSLSVPGTHYSGVTYDDLLEYLSDRGFRFTDDSKTAHDRVRNALLIEFERSRSVPTMTQLRAVARDALLEVVVLRFENKLRDVPIRSNAYQYAKQKKKLGFDSRPGIRTGQLLEAIERKGKVKVT